MTCYRLILFAIGIACGCTELDAQDAVHIDFGRDVQPLFKAHCIDCHGPQQQKNGFRLDRRRDALKGGTANQIGPGSSEASRLYLRLVGNQTGQQMPPGGPLSDGQIKIIKAWIDQGAVWPDAVSGEKPVPPPDASANQLMELVRAGNWPSMKALVRKEPTALNRKGLGGSTPLMYAVLYGDAETVRFLLENGADANLRNEAGATALMWAMDDLDKTRLLLRNGADVNARSDDGRTPLLVAGSYRQSYDVMKLLLDRGASPSIVVNSYRGPLTPLRLAAESGDEAALRLLLDRGADAKAMGGVLPLLAAMNAADSHCVQLLSHHADRRALKDAATFLVPPFSGPPALGNVIAVQKFFENGADIKTKDAAGRTLLMLAVSSDDAPPETIKLLLKLGVELNATSADGRTAFDYAAQQGKTAIVDLLVSVGAKRGRETAIPDKSPAPAKTVRAAIERSLPLLQRADVTFMKKSGCVSCHHNSLTAMTISAARKAGFVVDEKIARNQRIETGAHIEAWRERALQGMGIPGDSNTVNYLLVGLAAEEFAPNNATDALARYLKNDQLPDGRWRLIANRPPLESSEFEVAALALRGLQAYAPQVQMAAYEKTIWRAADWMRSAKPKSNADRTFQLLGLAWAGEEKASLEKLARALLAEQRADGGWGQLTTMPSDAYATGQALTALHESGVIPATAEEYQRGVEYLRSTQLEDGSWLVRSRAIPFQPYFESDFPHGPDQWISAAATNWATMALVPAASR